MSFSELSKIRYDETPLVLSFIERRLMPSDESTRYNTGDISSVEIRYDRGKLVVQVEIINRAASFPADLMVILREAVVQRPVSPVKTFFENIVNKAISSPGFIEFSVLTSPNITSLTWFDTVIAFNDPVNYYNYCSNYLGDLLSVMQARIHLIVSHLKDMKQQGYRVVC